MAENQNINNNENIENTKNTNNENIENDENIVNIENIEEDEKNFNEENKKQKKIEVVTGNGNLTISPVSRYIEVEKPRPKEDRKIVIPEVKNTVSNEENDSSK